MSFQDRFEASEPAGAQPLPIRPVMPAAEEYPIDAMAPLLRNAAHAIVDYSQVPVAIAGQTVLAAAALCVQAYVDVQLPTEDVVPTSLYCASVASSGERKTAADKRALVPVRAREDEMRRDHTQCASDFLTAKSAYDAARKKATTGLKNRLDIEAAIRNCGPEPIAPPQPMLICEEPTLPALLKAYAVSMPSLGLFSDEGAQFIGGYSMADDNRAATGAALSKLWDGSPIKRMRAGEDFSILPGRRLSVHLMFQPRVAGKLFGDKDLKDQGLLSRMLVCHPTSLFGTRMFRKASDDSRVALEKYWARMMSLLRGEMPMDPETRELRPAVMRLSEEATALAIPWYDWVEQQMAQGGLFEQIRGFAGKLPEHSIRIAAVMSYFQNKSADEPISAHSLAMGIELAKFYAGEALRLFGVGGADEDTDNAAAIIAWVREQKLARVGARLLGRYGPGRPLNGPQLKRAIGIMVDLKHLHPISGGAEVEFNGKVQFQREAYAVAIDEDG